MPESNRDTLDGLTQFAFLVLSRGRKLLILNGEMSEWLKEHAWKANPESFSEQYRRTAFHRRDTNFC